jgi:hypothetical protein
VFRGPEVFLLPSGFFLLRAGFSGVFVSDFLRLAAVAADSAVVEPLRVDLVPLEEASERVAADETEVRADWRLDFEVEPRRVTRIEATGLAWRRVPREARPDGRMSPMSKEACLTLCLGAGTKLRRRVMPLAAWLRKSSPLLLPRTMS